MEQENSPRIKNWTFLVPIGSLFFFAFEVFSHWYPSVRSAGFFFFYILGAFVLIIVFVTTIVACGLYLLLLRIKGQPSPKLVRELLIASSLSFIAFLSMFLVIRTFNGPLPTGSYLESFDYDGWNTAEVSPLDTNEITQRQKMLGNVVENLLPSSTRQEIENLLGPSLDTEYFQSTDRDLIYNLGPQRDSFFGIDSEWLLIWLDEQDRFLRYRIVSD